MTQQPNNVIDSWEKYKIWINDVVGQKKTIIIGAYRSVMDSSDNFSQAGSRSWYYLTAILEHNNPGSALSYLCFSQ